MQINNQVNNEYELMIESNEDLWILSQFIAPKDKIYSKSSRKVKIGEKSITKILFVELEVKNCEFENNSLRVLGIILNETEFTSIGQHHSLNFSIKDIIKIHKKKLLNYEKKLLEKASSSKKHLNLIILLEKDILILAEFGDFSYRIVSQTNSLGSKKYTNEDINENEEKFLIIKDFIKKDYGSIIFAGPAFFKNELAKYTKNKINLNSFIVDFHDVDASKIQNLIKKINDEGILEDNQIAIENKFISKLLENISNQSKYVYGENNTYDAIKSSKVETLLVSTKFINKKREDETYEILNEHFSLLENLNGELIIVNSKNDSGKILEGLGGIGGILRY